VIIYRHYDNIGWCSDKAVDCTCAIAQVIGCWLLTIVIQVQSQVSSYGVFVMDRMALGHIISEYLVCLPILIPPIAPCLSRFIHGQLVQWAHPTQRITRKENVPEGCSVLILVRKRAVFTEVLWSFCPSNKCQHSTSSFHIGFLSGPLQFIICCHPTI
jgi:hypothetical protein